VVVVFVEDVSADAGIVFTRVTLFFGGDQIYRDMVLIERDVVMVAGMVLQRIAHGFAGSIRGVYHVPMRVSAFTGQVQLTFAGFEDVAAERYAQFLQPADVLRAMLNGEFDGVDIGQAATYTQCVFDV